MTEKIYSFSFDLKAEPSDYATLYAAIKEYKSCQCLESTWMIATESSVKDLAESLEKHMKPGDRYLLQALPPDDYWGRVYKKYNTWNWIDERRKPASETPDEDKTKD